MDWSLNAKVLVPFSLNKDDDSSLLLLLFDTISTLLFVSNDLLGISLHCDKRQSPNMTTKCTRTVHQVSNVSIRVQCISSYGYDGNQEKLFSSSLFLVSYFLSCSLFASSNSIQPQLPLFVLLSLLQDILDFIGRLFDDAFLLSFL